MSSTHTKKGVSIHRGFPNAAADASPRALDLNKLLIKRPVSTFLMRISGNDWCKLGIFDGDIVIVDKAVSPAKNDLVAWWAEDSFIASAKHEVPADTTVWGVITSVIHQYRKT